MDLFEFASQKPKEEPEDEEEITEQISDEIISVGEITANIKEHITNRFGVSNFWVKGEISNFKGRNQSGHMYFRLKDDRAVLNCVFFRGSNRRLTVELKDGQEVLALGRIDVWERGGNYQLVVEEIRAGGTGELYLRFEQLKRKLEAEGLFDAARKRPLPEQPKRIGLVTSPTGAVIRDIIHVIRRRCPFVTLVLAPVKVQGDGAKEEIANAIRSLNDPSHKLDLLIVARGGGSIEDLWAFNEEDVARAIVGSRVPVVSAVGHQTDFTIADFVADFRAATPSHAAEMAVPNMKEFVDRVDMLFRNVVRELIRAREVAVERLQGLLRSAPLRDPRNILRDRAQRLDAALESMTESLSRRRERDGERVVRSREHLQLLLARTTTPRRLHFEKIASNLSLLNPLAVLGRGYSIVTREDQSIVTRHDQVSRNEKISVRLHEGALACEVIKSSRES